ncbi:MAG: hypothetical protein HY399_02155 [Elusimicrobia bacterium]|nr:hypothetical protein [Elusimicrobiota bacterium]
MIVVTVRQILTRFLILSAFMGGLFLKGSPVSSYQDLWKKEAFPAEETSALSRWTDSKTRAQRMMEYYLKNCENLGVYFTLQYRVQKAWARLSRMEKNERSRMEHLIHLVELDASTGKISWTEMEQRKEAVLKIFQLKMVLAYGSLFPRILETSLTNTQGEVAGELFLPDWEEPITKEEFLLKQSKYARISGFSMAMLGGI